MKALPDTASFRLKLQGLTPFAVGSGRILNRFDYTLTVNPRSGAPLIRIIDMERFYEDPKTPPEKKVEAIEKRQSGSLDRFSRNILACSFREAREGMEIVEFHRDAEGKPSVPASAVRGMLRTAVAFAALQGNPAALREGVEGAMEGRWKREGAAQKLERALFGRSQEDVFRSLRIGEARPASNEDLKAYEVAVMNLLGNAFRSKETFFIEAMAPGSGSSFEYDVTIDRKTLGAGGGGAPGGTAAHLRDREALLGALRAFSEAVLAEERRFYSEIGARDLGKIIDDTVQKAKGRAVLPFGHGSGWRPKTLGVLLGPAELQRLAPLLSPGRSYYRRGPRPIYPKTRRWVLDRFRPAEPLGWVAVEMS